MDRKISPEDIIGGAIRDVFEALVELGWAAAVIEEEWDDTGRILSGMVIGQQLYIEYVIACAPELNLVRLEKSV